MMAFHAELLVIIARNSQSIYCELRTVLPVTHIKRKASRQDYDMYHVTCCYILGYVIVSIF